MQEAKLVYIGIAIFCAVNGINIGFNFIPDARVNLEAKKITNELRRNSTTITETVKEPIKEDSSVVEQFFEKLADKLNEKIAAEEEQEELVQPEEKDNLPFFSG